MRAALELFTTVGFHVSTTPDIARRAGVAEGTIYRHFASKQDLLNEIYRAAVRLLVKDIEAQPPGTCRERLLTLGRTWRDRAAREPYVVRLVFLTRLDGLLDARSRDARAEFREALRRVIASGKANGEVRTGAVEVWADVWLTLVVLALDRVASRDWTPEQPAVGQVLEAAWDAIRAERSS